MNLFAFMAFAVVASADVATRLDLAEHKAAELEFEETRELLLEIVADPTATEAELFRAHLLAGEVDRVLQRDVDARMHFAWVLKRKPDAQLPPGRPPKVTTFFEMVREEVKDATPTPAPVVVVKEAEPVAPPRSSPVVPVVLFAGGGLVAVVGLVGAVTAEVANTDTAAPYDDRLTVQRLGALSWAGAAVGTVVAGSGAVWWLMGRGE